MHPLTFAATHTGQRTHSDLDHANLLRYTTDRQTDTYGVRCQVMTKRVTEDPSAVVVCRES